MRIRVCMKTLKNIVPNKIVWLSDRLMRTLNTIDSQNFITKMMTYITK